MKPDAIADTVIQTALAAEPHIEPDRAFTAMVMAAVHRDVELPPLRFPWRRFVLGLAASAAPPLIAGFTGGPVPTLDALDPVAWPVFALLGTWLCYKASMRLARLAA